MIRENPLKNIPVVDSSRVQELRVRFQIAEASDFSPEGEKGTGKDPWPRLSQAVLYRDSYRCRVCGDSRLSAMPGNHSEDRVHIDAQVHHIVPRKDGGADTMRNLITLCSECHHRTFSTDYSGVPVSNQASLLMAEEKINLALPPALLKSLGRAFRYGTVRDVARNGGDGAVFHGAEYSELSTLKTGISTMARSDYISVMKDLEQEFMIVDYRTVMAESSGVELKTRILILRDGKFLV